MSKIYPPCDKGNCTNELKKKLSGIIVIFIISVIVSNEVSYNFIPSFVINNKFSDNRLKARKRMKELTLDMK